MIMVRRIIPGIILMAGAATAAHSAPIERSFDQYAKPGRLVSVAPGRQLNLRCSGRGKVTILLESGLGYPSYSWRKVQPKLARMTRTCSYDRAGLGFSDPGPMPRTASAMADDIVLLVKGGALKPPFVLVGGSLGGQIVRLYAFRHREQVIGLVLVDPYAEGQYRSFAAVEPSIAQEARDVAAEELRCVVALRAGLAYADAEAQGCIDAPPAEFSKGLKAIVRNQRMAAKSFETTYSESLMLDTENEKAIARERRDLSPLPVIVLSATNEFNSQRLAKVRPALLAEKARLHRGLAALSARGEMRRVDAAHVIQADDPDTVVRAVRDVLAAGKRPQR